MSIRNSLIRSESGSTAVEFALILPVLVTLIMGSIELSLFFFVQSSIEGATFSVSRLGKTGYVESGMTREQTIHDAMQKKLGFFLDMKKMKIESKAYADFNVVGAPEPFIDANHNGVRDENENYTDVNGNGRYDSDMGQSGAGDMGQVVVYTVTYPWSVLTPVIKQYIGNGGKIDISSRMVVKNEPYDDD